MSAAAGSFAAALFALFVILLYEWGVLFWLVALFACLSLVLSGLFIYLNATDRFYDRDAMHNAVWGAILSASVLTVCVVLL